MAVFEIAILAILCALLEEGIVARATSGQLILDKGS
jgi:hypothetical protein